MADLKKLIGNALNKAKSTKPSDDGYATRTVKGMTPKQGREYKHKEVYNDSVNARDKLERMTSDLRDRKKGYNYNAPASSKTPKPAPVQSAIDKRNKEQAKWNDKYSKGDVRGSSNDPKYGGGGPGGKYVKSPAMKEYESEKVKRITKPGGMEKELTMFDRSLGKRRKDKFGND
jgi:hypothetical protein